MEHGYFHPDRGYWQTTNEPPQHILDGYPEGTVYVPVKPSGLHEWNGTAWVEVLPDLAETLASWRDTASLPKAEFCTGLIGLGILTTDDAVSASRGNWPDAMAGFLTYLTPEQAAQVQIEWATRTTIRRMNTFVLTLASWASLTDAGVDAMFGWVAP